MRDSPHLTLIGRVLLGLIFLVSAVNKISDPQGTQHYMTLMGMTWMTTLLLIFHTNLSDPNQVMHFLKNLSMMGGLLYVAQYGAGRYSMDAGLERADVVEAPRPLRKVVHH